MCLESPKNPAACSDDDSRRFRIDRVVPAMTVGPLLFVGVVTSWIAFATRLEERDLLRAHGDGHTVHRRRVPMLIPRLGRIGGGRVGLSR